jgi:hypothetical protein
MRRKVLQDHANVFCQMFVGWRMIANDIPTLVRLRHGPLTIDVLTGTAKHADAPIRNLYIAGELQAWFAAQLAEHNIPREAIAAAVVYVDFDATAVPRRRHDRFKLAFDCRSLIETADRKYEGRLSDTIEVVNVQAI